MLTQSEADTLIALPKKVIVNQTYCFPVHGDTLSIPLHSNDDRVEFLIDINRAKIRLTQCTYQERYNPVAILVRLDIDGPPHTNPQTLPVPLSHLTHHNGKTIDCPHLHLYVEGFMDKWAIPAPIDKFTNTTDLYATLNDFFKYCNVINPPTIKKSMTQRSVFHDIQRL